MGWRRWTGGTGNQSGQVQYIYIGTTVRIVEGGDMPDLNRSEDRQVGGMQSETDCASQDRADAHNLGAVGRPRCRQDQCKLLVQSP